jgi:anti-anti-sigma factor
MRVGSYSLGLVLAWQSRLEAALMVNIELGTRVSGGYVVVALCGELDVVDADSVAAAVAALAEGGQQLIIDLEGLGYVDCRSLRALLGARETSRHGGGDLLLAAPRGMVLRMLTLLELPGVYASVAAAAENASREGARSAAGLPAVSALDRGFTIYPDLSGALASERCKRAMPAAALPVQAAAW